MSIEKYICRQLKKDKLLPKSQIIAKSIVELITKRELTCNDRLPSLQKIARRCGISVNTVVKAFDILKQDGIIDSVVAQGFYVATDSISHKYNIFLLLDELNMFKEEMYNSLKSRLGDTAKIDIFFHHDNREVFTSLLSTSKGRYTHYIVMPLHKQSESEWINDFPKNRTLILDYLPQCDSCNFVSQDLNRGTFYALSEINDKIFKYSRFNYIFPPKEIEYAGQLIEKGFRDFCDENTIKSRIIRNLSARDIVRNEAYLVARETDLIKLVHVAHEKKLCLGKDIGVISYNETELKEIIEGGITVISTDFSKLGQKTAEFVQSKEIPYREIIPTKIIMRNSL